MKSPQEGENYMIYKLGIIEAGIMVFVVDALNHLTSRP